MWPFSSKAKPTPIILLPPPILDTWRAGDVAECIRDTWIGLDGEGVTPPRRGSRTFVTTVFHCDLTGHTFLVLAGYGAENNWYAGGFRKIVAPFVGADNTAELDEGNALRTPQMAFRRVGKKAAGRRLHGITHDGVPA